jgi:cell division control protein 24
LPTFLIKPLQRIYDYPLLFQKLLKELPPDHKFYHELGEGMAACVRIVEKCSEATRRADNTTIVKMLVNDWQGLALVNLGELLLDDVFVVTKSDVDHECHVFLFERVILCAKNATTVPNEKAAKSNLMRGANDVSIAPAVSAATTPLSLKRQIFLCNLAMAVLDTTNGEYPIHNNSPIGELTHRVSLECAGQCALHVWWHGVDDLEYITLGCKDANQLELWGSVITRLLCKLSAKQVGKPIGDLQIKRQTSNISIATSRSSTQTLPPYPGPPAPQYTSDPHEKAQSVPQYRDEGLDWGSSRV